MFRTLYLAKSKQIHIARRLMSRRLRRLAGPAIGILIVVGLGVLIWEEGLEHRVVAKNLGLVEPGLWRSGQISPHAIGPTLHRTDVDVIVSLSPDKPWNAHNMAEFRAAHRMGIRREHVNLRGDGTGDPQEYVNALTWIIEARRQDRNVLVHCWAGSERTSGVAALYRTLVLGHSAEAVVSEMDDYGHDVDEGVLLDYLNENIGIIARGLKENGMIGAVPQPLPVFERP